jgi:radical SAM superfamily enzyme YgiQ (UPF0313 family)
MYASINNIMHKSDEELVELSKLGISDLWVGVETGLEDALDYLNKGSSLTDVEEQLERLNIAGITFYYGFMFGAAGRSRGIENAIANAKLINNVKPLGIVPTTLNVNEGTKLATDVSDGNFQMATEREVLEEQIKTIELVNIPTRYMGIHAINSVSFDAELPKNKDTAVSRIKYVKENTTEEVLDSIPFRHAI